jgi:hypothetical protein
VKLKTLLVLNAVASLVFGVGFVLIPAFVVSIYGLTQGPTEILAGRYFGAALIVVGLLCWFARDVTDALARRAIILGVLIGDVIGVVVSVQGTLSGVMNKAGWSTVGIYLFFVLGFAYVLMKESSPE